ncbi:DUF6177 family protein [Actinomadura keratinilytica]|jgi:hypothetical protein|uniref:DUF6177 family protein n=1 Tax=Actinomadura keratinilytica TaxID=547461 RepID=UPI0031ED29A0
MSIVDALTDQAMVVLQDRPLVALHPWLAGLLDDCTASGRTLHLVTPIGTRLSLPLRSVAAGRTAQWVVRDGDGFYAGLTGRPLRWDGATFVPVPDARDYAPGFKTRPTAPIGAQLALVYRARHRRGGGTLGGAAGHLLRLLTGRPPAAWGPAEPLAHPWDPDRFTEHARGRASARLLVIGDGPRTAQAVCEFTAAGKGATTETTTVTVGHAPGAPPPLGRLPSLIAELAAEQPVASLLAQLVPGRADLTTEPRWTGEPAVVSLAVAGAVAGPPGIPGRQIGPPDAPVTLFPLGDGRSPDGWRRHREVMRHLQSALRPS